MAQLELIAETKHEELLKLINPLVDFMNENGFHYFIIAGKDEECTRHMKGTFDDLEGMLIGMMQNNKGVESLIKSSINQFKTK